METLEIVKYLSIPVVASIVGWVTNWLAVKLTFYPIEFIGIPPYLGWQGIVPMKARKMAGISVDTSLQTIGSVSDIAKEIDLQVLAQHAAKALDPDIPLFLEEQMLVEIPVLWNNAPQALKNKVIQRVRAELPKIIAELMEEVEGQIESLLDLKRMIQDHLGENKALVVRIFLEVGDKEFKFIINSGIYFGGLFGIVQMLVWYYFPAWWILPVFGLIVGYATNWIALKLIFKPLNPIQVGPYTVQGLFLKRQDQVSETYSEIITEEILTIPNMINEMLTGPKSHKAEIMLKKHMRRIVDETAGLGKPIVQGSLGPTGFANLKERAAEKALTLAENSFVDAGFNEERSKVIQGIMKERMKELTPEAFQNMLRPAFQEDEWKLILAGGILGAIAGFAQLVFIFS